jgi:hypothetical protein
MWCPAACTYSIEIRKYGGNSEIETTVANALKEGNIAEPFDPIHVIKEYLRISIGDFGINFKMFRNRINLKHFLYTKSTVIFLVIFYGLQNSANVVLNNWNFCKVILFSYSQNEGYLFSIMWLLPILEYIYIYIYIYHYWDVTFIVLLWLWYRDLGRTVHSWSDFSRDSLKGRLQAVVNVVYKLSILTELILYYA